MVLGFGSKSTKKRGKGQEQPVIRPSPSLPIMSAQGIPWPDSLVDVAEIVDMPPQSYPAQGAAKTSFSSLRNAAIPFHKPFRVSPAVPPNMNGGTISALYMSSPPSAFSIHQRASTYPAKPRASQRRSRVPPTFNLMVAGAQGTGKTSLLRLLVDTADISPTATPEQRADVDKFLRGSSKATEVIQAASVEICESKFDHVVLAVIDTPGLDFREGRELTLERQVSNIIKYIDRQYAETMGEEFKVIRKSKGDQHVHLCIYLIDPDSVMSPSQRRSKSSLPRNSQSEVTLSSLRREAGGAVEGPPVADNDEEELNGDTERLAMSTADLRVIRRLSNRVNVLPVVARADSLTDDKLKATKAAIQRDLHNAGLGFGVFGHGKTQEEARKPQKGNGNGHADTDEGIGSDEEQEDDERQSRPVIKLRHNRAPGRSSSRSRIDASEALDSSIPLSPDATDPDSIASVRFSAHIIAQKAPLEHLLPFALIMPEQQRHRRALKQPPPSRPESRASAMTAGTSFRLSENEQEKGLQLPASVHNMPYLQGPPRDLKGVFLRRFRWGTVDVLDPSHCDFAALRTAVLSTHIKVLKTNTKEVLYEKFRTEKLLARRATQNISEDAHKRLLEDLGL